jgi:hypothetical protein
LPRRLDNVEVSDSGTNYYAGTRRKSGDLFAKSNAVKPRQRQVYDNDIRFVGTNEVERGLAACGGRYNVEIRFQQRDRLFEEGRVIVSDDYSDSRCQAPSAEDWEGGESLRNKTLSTCVLTVGLI